MTARIDWRGQFAALKPFIDGQGGVVHLCGAPRSGVATFCKTLRSLVQAADGLTIRLAADDHETRTGLDMAAKFYAKLGIAPSNEGHNHILRDIVSRKGDVNIHHVDIKIEGDSLGEASGLSESMSRIHEGLVSAVQVQRVLVLLSQSHSMPFAALQWFWEDFWEARPPELQDSSLLVVDAHDPARRRPRMDGVRPAPDVTIRLPDTYADDSLQHAMEDLIETFMAHGDDDASARTRAETLMAASDHAPQQIHSALPAVLLTIGVVDGH